MDNRLSRNTKLRLYNLSVCSTLTHSCQARKLIKVVLRIVIGVKSRCMHNITLMPPFHPRRPTALCWPFDSLGLLPSTKVHKTSKTATSASHETPGTSHVGQGGTPNTHGHDRWRQPLPGGDMDYQRSELQYIDTLAKNHTERWDKVATVLI